MYDINIENVKRGKKFFFIFILAGIFFSILFLGMFVFNIIKLNSFDSIVLSTRVDLNPHISDSGGTVYSPIYYYEVNGNNYSCRTDLFSSIKPSEENQKIYYDSLDPSNCMSEYSKLTNYLTLTFLFLPLSFIVFALINIKKIDKRIKIINELNKKGKLVKNLPYRLENTGMTLNNRRIKRLVVDYKLSTGTVITLYGDARHDRKHYDEDGMVDLLIDESNPENFYIDFEINRLTGNLSQDYYQQNQIDLNDSYQNYK